MNGPYAPMVTRPVHGQRDGEGILRDDSGRRCPQRLPEVLSTIGSANTYRQGGRGRVVPIAR
eukprot:8442213-Lingulodinium_polyedra.AAC.1